MLTLINTASEYRPAKTLISNRNERIGLFVACLIIAIGFSSVSHACNIPVFRYALERWKCDAYEVIVFQDERLSVEQNVFLKSLQATSVDGSESANFKLTQAFVGSQATDEQVQLWKELQDTAGAKLPYMVIRTKIRADKSANCWHGSLDQAIQAKLLQSPKRKELASRLLGGDSVVWLMLKSKSADQTKATRKLLDSATNALSTKIQIPEGVGLPGSELFSEIPLLMQFSVLEIDPNDENEQFLVKLLTGIQSEAFADGEPLVVPVFGRGRALEVIPASTLTEQVVEDLTVFLSGPCSCQVKDRNPGFDLLISADWNTDLFGVDGVRPPTTSPTEPGKKPKLLTIPKGRDR